LSSAKKTPSATNYYKETREKREEGKRGGNRREYRKLAQNNTIRTIL